MKRGQYSVIKIKIKILKQKKDILFAICNILIYLAKLAWLIFANQLPRFGDQRA